MNACFHLFPKHRYRPIIFILTYLQSKNWAKLPYDL